MTYKKPINILLVEDNPGDAELIREALKRGGYEAKLHIAQDAQEAMNFLLKRNGHAAAARPGMILLDLSLPGKSGQELLVDIKKNVGLVDIPVIVLTGSESDEDVAQASAHHANCYIAKPKEGLDASMDTLGRVLHFWLEVARLPC